MFSKQAAKKIIIYTLKKIYFNVNINGRRISKNVKGLGLWFMSAVQEKNGYAWKLQHVKVIPLFQWHSSICSL